MFYFICFENYSNYYSSYSSLCSTTIQVYFERRVNVGFFYIEVFEVRAEVEEVVEGCGADYIFGGATDMKLLFKS